jgi:NAD+ synthase (glutamine-hydrolysing)
MALKVLGSQFTIVPGSPERNTVSMVSIIEQNREHFHVLVFAEMAVPGYLIGDAWERPGFLARCEQAHEKLRQASTGICIIFGSVGTDRNSRGEDGRPRLYNAAHVFQDGRVVTASHLGLPFWPKTLLANYREFDDARHFYDLRRLAQDRNQSIESAIRPAIINGTDGQPVAVGITICEDAWCEDYSINPVAVLGEYGRQATMNNHPPLKLVVNLSASPFTKGKRSKRHRVFTKRATEAGVPLLYVNTLGIQNNGKNMFAFDGRSALYSNNQIHECRAYEPASLAFDAATGTITTGGNRLESVQPSNENAPDEHAIFGDRIENTAAALIFAVKQTCALWNIKNVVIGASGGIDSAVVATLFTHALGAPAVTLVNMPSRYNSALTKSAAAELAKNLGTRLEIFDIEASVAATTQQIFSQPPFTGLLNSAISENIQARDRGSRILAAVAAAMGGVFSCNSNKTEITIGYSTLYGDAAGFFAPIGDLWKTEVYALAHYLNGIRLPGDQTPLLFEAPVIPRATLEVTPSAELSPLQDVTQGLGDPLCYPYHDSLFRLWIESWMRFDLQTTIAAYDSGELVSFLDTGKDDFKKLFKTREAFVADCTRWWNLYTGMAAFKRVQLPPVLSLSRRSFGFDHRESIGPT